MASSESFIFSSLNRHVVICSHYINRNLVNPGVISIKEFFTFLFILSGCNSCQYNSTYFQSVFTCIYWSQKVVVSSGWYDPSHQYKFYLQTGSQSVLDWYSQFQFAIAQVSQCLNSWNTMFMIYMVLLHMRVQHVHSVPGINHKPRGEITKLLCVKLH